ncbi:MAG: hypothetical protein ACRDLF_05190 [Solirubrobacteraceae bacterium]
MMRRASTRRALLGLGVVGLLAGLPASAAAKPEVTLKAAAVPIPINLSNPHSATYPGTGDILGAGAALEVEFKITGTEYGGSPAPITQIKTYAPAGTKLTTKGFATCSETVLKEKGPEGCPKKSYASPIGEAQGHVSFGSERVYEKLTVQGFFAPGGGLLFFADGRSPASIELISKGTITNGGGAFGPTVTAEVPLVESVPGALDGSAEFIKVKVGAAYKKHGKLISYGTVPKKCPKGGFPLKTEMTFLGGEVVTSEYHAPCPKHKK